ncbi:MAG: hypothetical protein JWL72_468 [Ilumatobacteraceae bacterium]|nr:hypothetical protein [Ilumatobacteraceae bacterium]
MAFAIGLLVMIGGLWWFVDSAVQRAPLSRAARPVAWELLPVRYVPLGVAALIAFVMVGY